MKALSACAILMLAVLGPASAQDVPTVRGPATTGAIVEVEPNITGNTPGLVIAPGPNGADTITTDSAAGGNASQPSRAIPRGGADGGGDGG